MCGTHSGRPHCHVGAPLLRATEHAEPHTTEQDCTHTVPYRLLVLMHVALTRFSVFHACILRVSLPRLCVLCSMCSLLCATAHHCTSIHLFRIYLCPSQEVKRGVHRLATSRAKPPTPNWTATRPAESGYQRSKCRWATASSQLCFGLFKDGWGTQQRLDSVSSQEYLMKDGTSGLHHDALIAHGSCPDRPPGRKVVSAALTITALTIAQRIVGLYLKRHCQCPRSATFLLLGVEQQRPIAVTSYCTGGRYWSPRAVIRTEAPHDISNNSHEKRHETLKIATESL